MCRAKDLFSKDDMEDIQQAITWAELDTSGEIRVHIEDTCPGDPMERGKEIFRKLGMGNTELRNGLLFYLATESRKFAIVKDEGVQAIMSNGFWDVIHQKMLNHFREERFTEGLCEGITFAGEQLRKFFPRRKKDRNELPDEVTFGSDLL
jgi:uncharacterized membrane protein